MVSRPVKGDVISVEWLVGDELLVCGTYQDGGMGCINMERPYKYTCLMWNPYAMSIIKHLDNGEHMFFQRTVDDYLKEKGRTKLSFKTVEY